MRLVAAEDYDDLSRRAAAMVIDAVRDRPDCVLVLPTGTTPLGLFRELIAAVAAGIADFAHARFVTLDDYAGIDAADRRRLLLWLKQELLDRIGVVDDRIVAFDSTAEPLGEAARVEAAIAMWGGIDLAIVGLGPNGHLAFNEPGSAFDSRARRITLTPESIRSNAAYWGTEADVPREGLTLGLGTLRAARQLVLIASGVGKRDILAQTLHGPIGEDLPATLLRVHPHATVIADRAALSS